MPVGVLRFLPASGVGRHCVRIGSHNDCLAVRDLLCCCVRGRLCEFWLARWHPFRPTQPNPGRSQAIVRGLAHISAIWPFHKRATILVAYVQACVSHQIPAGIEALPVGPSGCVCSGMREMTDVGDPAAWPMGSVGLRMPRRTQAVKSVMTQWLSAAMPPATYVLTCVTSRMPPVVLVSAVYLAGCVCLGMRTCPDM